MLSNSFTYKLVWLMITTCLGTQAVADDRVVLRFVEYPTTESSVVKLSDVVEIVSGRSSTLTRVMEMPLGPAPRQGQVQRWHSEDILQHLELRGIHAGNIRWSGAQTAELRRGEKLEVQTASMTPAFTSDGFVEQAARNVSQAISEYLNLKNSQRLDWRIEAKVPVEYVPLLKVRRQIVSIGGGQAPWIGKQQFVLEVKHIDGKLMIPIEAEVQMPPMVVAAARSFRRGELITPDMLTYRQLTKSEEQREQQYFTNFEQCLDKEVRRSVSTGQPLTPEAVGAPIVVSRNDIIEVEAISGPIVVRTAAKAIGSGAIGDLIEIELQPTRQRMHAAVVGQSLVRVAAVSARANNR
jgi:flagella basal body P-ring formation protein FlgA